MRSITRHTLCALAILFGGQHAHALTSESCGPEQALEPTSSFGGKGKIWYGKPTTFNKNPWQVGLVIDGDLECGGSAIGERSIVTAAHCLAGIPDDAKVEVMVGSTDFNGGVSIDVEKFVVHPEYNEDTCANDVAMVWVDSTRPAMAIALPTPGTHIRIGEHLTATGFGETEDGAPSDQLLEGKVPYVDNETCNRPESYGGQILPGMMCAGSESGGTDACKGDSGGPLTKGHGANAVLVGITSWGDECGKPLKYGVYTRVSYYLEWIVKEMSKHGD
ncbi:serine protease [Mesorhizobium sp. AaZ16]|uniref:serine protease n=1 Tax=Mesorhizobium sp. AaZ16 TaxID=3402289 RepID=UPI00374FD79A